MLFTALSACCSSTALFGVVLLLCFLFYVTMRRPKGFPPGPIALPIVGYAPFVGSNVGETLRKMKGKYGPIFSIQMGREYWVVLNDYQAIHEALVKRGDVFSGRPTNVIYELSGVVDGLALADYGERWKNLRKFGLMTLRGFGVGKKSVEEGVIEEAPYLVEDLITKNGYCLRTKLMCAVANLISRIVFGRRFSYTDKRFRELIRVLIKLLSSSSDNVIFGILLLAPEMRHLPVIKGRLNDALKELDTYDDIFKEFIQEHRVNFDENDIRDFIDAFLKEMKQKGPADPDFTDKVLRLYIRDLFEGGSTTTSTTIEWMILAFVSHPEIQEKIWKEVADVLGDSGRPSMSHRDQMPYTCAFIHEITRHRTLLPLSVFHKTNSACELGGYKIPANTTVIPNIWAAHHDPELFDRPEEFRPERFLTADGKFVNSPHVIPFSVGPRHCIGEQLARMELFLFLVTIVQKLEVLPDPEKPPPPLAQGQCASFTYESPPFEVIFKPR